MEDQPGGGEGCDAGKHRDRSITKAQRNCLSHILRNLTTSINFALRAIEDEQHSPTATEIQLYLREIPFRTDQILKALERGSFCGLDESQCSFVSKHVGCNPDKDRD